MKVLVTGSDGFIGSHLVESLVLSGFDVRAMCQYNSFGSWGWLEQLDKKIIASIDVIAGDVRDPHFVKQAMVGCDAVLHLAALIAIPFSYEAPDSYLDTNIKGTLNVMRAAMDIGVSKVIQTSTSEVYGTAQFVPITEAHPLQAQSPYAASKIGADAIASSFYSSFGLPVCVIRPFNTYGPRQSARAVIPTVITQIAAGERTIKLGSLHPTRDFNYVADTVAGFISALRTDGCEGEVINLGSSFEVSIGETVKLISDLMDTDIEIICSEERMRPKDSEVDRLLADNSKAKNLLGWTPRFSGRDGLKKGLMSTVEWFQNPTNLKFYKTNIFNK